MPSISPKRRRASSLPKASSSTAATVAALIQEGIRPRGDWGHDFVQGQFVGQLVIRRKRFSSELRRTLPENQALRDQADYLNSYVSQIQAGRALRRARKCISEIEQRKAKDMYEEPDLIITPEMQAAIDELKGMIAERFPEATFDVRQRYDPAGVSLHATVDIEDTDEVFEVVVDRLIDLQVEEGLPIYVAALRPLERVLADIEARRASVRPCLQRTG